MEQKQTLWIIAAAGMFLLVVLGAAFILYSPAKNPVPAPVTQTQLFNGNNSGWSQQNPAAEYTNTTQLTSPLPSFQTQAPEEITTDELTVFADNAVLYSMNTPVTEEPNETTIDLNNLKEKETQPQNINITVNIPEPKTVVTPVTTVPAPVPEVKDFRKEESRSTNRTIAKTESSSVKVVKKAENKSAPAKTKPAETKAAPKSEEKVLDRYWVQAASFSTKKTAEDARAVLDANKIPADIFTYTDAKGKTYYRVRVGPYTTKSEAEYWRARILKISDFAKSESYITVN